MNIIWNSPCRPIKVLSLVAVMGFCLAGQPAMAVTKNWNVASGNWNVGTNWNVVGVPIAGDSVRLNNGGLLNITDNQASLEMHVGFTAPGDNRVDISSSGTLTTTALSRIGYSAGTQGTVSVDGVWTGAGGIYLGGGGAGDMTIGSGGNFTDGALTMGAGLGAVGTLTIDSSGSVNMSSVSIGHSNGGRGDVFVSGTLTDSGALIVGATGTGSITIESGGVVTSVGRIDVSTAVAGTGDGTLLVRGSLSNTADIWLGHYGKAVLTIGDGGTVNVNGGTGKVELARQNSSASGIFNIGGAVSGTTPGVAEGAGVLNATEVKGRASGGTSTVNFNHTDSDYFFTQTGLTGGSHILISGATTTVNLYSGKTTLKGANTYGGGTVVTGSSTLVAAHNTALGSAAVSVEQNGTLEIATGFTVANAVTINAGTLLVNGTSSGAVGFGASGGAIAGGGTVNGAVTLNNVNQTISPGNSPGIVSFDTGQTWDSFTYVWELNDWTAAVAGTNFDQIAITGALDLSGAGTDDIVLDITSLTAGDVPGDVPNFGESDEQWIILTTSGGITGFDAADWSVLPANFDSTPAAAGTWSVSQIGDNVVLSYTAIPEPTVATLLLAGASFGFLTLRRRRQG